MIRYTIIALLVLAAFIAAISRKSDEDRPTATAKTWLLAAGWRRWGLLDLADEPGNRSRRKKRTPSTQERIPRATPLPFAVSCEPDLTGF